jgi:hypothetical protein
MPLPPESWHIHKGEPVDAGKEPDRVRVDLRFTEGRPKGYSKLLWISFATASSWLAPLGEAWIEPAAREIQEDLETVLSEGLGALPVGERRSGDKTTVYVYLASIDRYRDAIISVMKSYPNVTYDYGLEHDSGWNAYRALLPR